MSGSGSSSGSSGNQSFMFGTGASGNQTLLYTPRTQPAGTTATCKFANQSLLPCGVTDFTFVEPTTDPAKGTSKTRSFSRAINSTSEQGHPRLVLKVDVTAPPEGRLDRPPRMVTLTANGPGPCSDAHLSWSEAGQPPGGASHEIAVRAGRTPNKAINDWYEGKRAALRDDGRNKRALATHAEQALLVGPGVLLDGMTGIFRRSSRVLTLTACGNPASSTTNAARVEMTIFRREKFEFELNIPFMGKSAGFSGPKLGSMKAEGKDTNLSCKLTIDDSPFGSHELGADLSKIQKIVKGVYTVKDLLSEAIANAPAAGVFFEGDLKGPEGQLTLALQWRENDDETVSLWWQISCALKLITASLSVHYGVKIRFAQASVFLEVMGSLEMILAKGARQEGYQGIRYGAAARRISVPLEGKLEFMVGATGKAGSVLVIKAGAKVPFVWEAEFGVTLPEDRDSNTRADLKLGDLKLKQVMLVCDVSLGGIFELNVKHPITKSERLLVKGGLD